LPFLSTQFEQRDGAQETQLARLQAGALLPTNANQVWKEQRNPDLEKERAHTSYISSQIHMDKQHSYSVAQFSPSLLKQLHSIDLPSLLPPVKTDPSMIP
jgi:hypothetical protein